MADIAMLLLIFFMSTSIIRSREGAAVRLPGATAGQRIRAEESIRVSIGPEGRIAFNDAAVPLASVGPLLAEKFARRPGLVIALYADARTPYSVVTAVLDQMKAARAPRVTLATTRRGLLAGVCAGIAEYFGLNRKGVRLVTVRVDAVSSVLRLRGHILCDMAIVLPVKPADLYETQEQAEFWRGVSNAPSDVFGALSHRFRQLNQRLERMEAFVTSKEFEIDRELGRR